MTREAILKEAKTLTDYARDQTATVVHDEKTQAALIKIHTDLYAMQEDSCVKNWLAWQIGALTSTTLEEKSERIRRLLETIENGPAAAIAEIREKY